MYIDNSSNEIHLDFTTNSPRNIYTTTKELLDLIDPKHSYSDVQEILFEGTSFELAHKGFDGWPSISFTDTSKRDDNMITIYIHDQELEIKVI